MPLRAWMASFWRNIRHRDRVDAALDEEMRACLEMLVDEKLAEGLSPEVARRAARLEFGGPEQIKEEVRDIRAGAWLEGIWSDLRYGARALAATPIVTVVAALSLGLGIGANTAIYRLARATLMPPPSVPGVDRVFHVADARGMFDGGPIGLSYRQSVELAELAKPIGTAGAWLGFTWNLTTDAGVTRDMVLFADGGALDALDLGLQAGRWPTLSEQRSRAHVTVLTDRFWREQFPNRPVVHGQIVRIGPLPFTVIGVTSARFRGHWPDREFAAIVPAGTIATLRDEPDLATDWGGFNVVLRLHEGVPEAFVHDRARQWTLAGAPGQWTPAGAQEAGKAPEPLRVVLRPFGEWLTQWARATFADWVWLLSGITLAVLLVGCLNVAAMLLSKAEARGREMALRASLGASRGRLLRQLFVEVGLLGMLSAAAALLVSQWVLDGLPKSSVADIQLDRIAGGLDGTVVAVAALVTVATCVLCGLASALPATRLDLLAILRSGGSTTTPRTSRTRRWLLGTQIGAATALLTLTGLFIHSVQQMLDVPLGFDRQGLLTAEVRMPWPNYDVARSIAIRQRIVERLMADDRVASAGLSSSGLFQHWRGSLRVEVDGVDRTLDAPLIVEEVDPTYRQTLGLPLLRGRDLTTADREGAPGVVLVNEALARRLWPTGDAIGRRLRIFQRGFMKWRPTNGDLEVVGVVGNGRFEYGRTEEGAMLLPRSQSETNSSGGGMLFVRVREGARDVATQVLQVIQSEVKDEPAPPVLAIRDRLQEFAGPERVVRWLLAWFAAVALALGLAGVFGLVAHGVGQRRRELAVRAAFGARSPQIVATVARGTAWPVAIGVAGGLLAAAASGRLVAHLLFDTRPFDAGIYAVGGGAVLASAILAAWGPVRGATRINAVEILRAE